ncbi:MAG: NEW3 domain-containing protein [Steroidobacteraceae bacterium]
MAGPGLGAKTLKPGTRATARVSLSAGGDETLHGVTLSLQGPGGWQVVLLGRTTRNALAPRAAEPAKFVVTPRPWAVA